MKVAVVLPRGMHFSPQGATSIDVVARDLAIHSRYKDTTFIIGSAVQNPFDEVSFRPVDASSQKAFVAEAQQMLIAERPDIVVVHQHSESANKLAAAMPGVPVMLHRHGLMRHKNGFLSKWRKGRHLRHLSGIVFVSEFLRSRFLDVYPELADKTFVVHNGIDTDLWKPAPKKENTIVFAGRAREDKGIVPLIQAFRELAPAGWTLKLALVVQTPQERRFFESIKAMVCGVAAVSIFSNLTHREVAAELGRGRIMAAPSIVEEGFPRSIIEARAAGCEVIVSSGGGSPEAAGNRARYIDTTIADNIVPQLVDALRDAIADWHNSAQRVAAGSIQRAFGIPEVARQYDDIMLRTAQK